MTKTISAKDLHEKLQDKNKKLICIDVRTEGEHDSERIPNTINIPIDQLKNHSAELKKYDEIYLHCSSGSRSQIACNILSKCGFKNQYSVEGGLNAWKMEKLPTAGNNKTRIPIIRQVFIVAGTMIMAGLIFSIVLQNDLYLTLPLLVSVGFLYAGFSGNCLMSKLLINAPWNQHKD